MYRFFCETCNKVKRVQKVPSRISNTYLGKIEDRIGVCDSHSRTYIPKISIIKSNKVETPVASSSKKGKRR